MKHDRRTIQHRREIIQSAVDAAQARTRGREIEAQAYVDAATVYLRRQTGSQGPASRLFGATYKQEWESLHPENVEIN